MAVEPQGLGLAYGGAASNVRGTCHTEIAQAAKCQAAALVNGQIYA